MLPISCFIIAENEERCIGEVIDSAKTICNEIIVVDSGSTDTTLHIAKSLGAKTLFREWSGYGDQKRFAEDQCLNKWLLNLDADEVLSQELQDEIKQLFTNGEPKQSLYKIKVTTVYPGERKPRWLAEHNDVIRLYDKTVARFPKHPTWDAITAPRGLNVGLLKSPCFHFSSPGLDHYVNKFNRYTTLQAKKTPIKNPHYLLIKLILGFPVDFFKAYIIKRHFTGGTYGFILAFTHAFSRFLKVAKMIEHLKFK